MNVSPSVATILVRNNFFVTIREHSISVTIPCTPCTVHFVCFHSIGDDSDDICFCPAVY